MKPEMKHEQTVLQIISMAMQLTASGKAEVFAHYSGHTRELHLFAHPVGSDYQPGAKRVYLVDLVAYLDWDSGEHQLNRMINQLHLLSRVEPQDLVMEAVA